jgi:hypothetical protein
MLRSLRCVAFKVIMFQIVVCGQRTRIVVIASKLQVNLCHYHVVIFGNVFDPSNHDIE